MADYLLDSVAHICADLLSRKMFLRLEIESFLDCKLLRDRTKIYSLRD